jgi:hypothetical protein
VLVKDSPPALRVLVDAFTVELLDIVMSAACHEGSCIGPVTLLIVAVQPVNVTEPKSARGSTLELDGASAIHSALERAADFSALETEKDLPVVTSLRDRVNFAVLAVYFTSAVMVFPGFMVMLRVTGAAGYISYHP